MLPIATRQSQRVCALASQSQFYLRLRILILFAAALVVAAPRVAHSATVCGKSTAGFLRSIVGEWIGSCRQTTDGEEADDKYFHAVVKEIDPSTFESRFDYYRIDAAKGTPVKVGDSAVITKIASDGSANNHITGQGTVLVYQKPKKQRHDMSETIRMTGERGLKGEGKGTIAVSGMPLGLGKNGKITNCSTSWAVKDGSLRVEQNLQVCFRALVFSKKFKVTAHYTAKRGSDVASLMLEHGRVSASTAATFH